MKKRFSTNHLSEVFAEEGKYEAFKKLTFDLNHGNDIFEYDEESGETRKISNHEANQAIRKILMEVCELDEEDLKSAKRRARMLKAHQMEIFELLESDIDFKVETGFRDNEWFNEFVDYRNIKLGDDEEFWVSETNKYFVVAKISGDHHDLTMQHIAPNAPLRVHTNHYGIKVGKDIDLILLGRIDFTTLTDKIADSFINYIQNLAYTEVYNAADKLPSQFKGTGALDAASKAGFDELIENVETANGEEVVIMGTKVALKKINALSDVDWRSASQKESVANTGRLGNYEGTTLVEIPQRFALNDFTQKLIDNDILLIVPLTKDKMVKVIDKGETMIIERGDQKADLADDFKTYEVQRELGVATVLGSYFGMWEM